MAGSRRERELAKQKLQRQLDKQAATATKSQGRNIAVIAGVVVIALIVIGAVIAKANSGSTTASRPTPTISSAPVAYKCTPVTKLQTVAKQYPNGPENITLAQGLTLGVKLKTNCGDITIDLESQSAPENTKALIFLANTGASQVLVPGDQNSGVRQVEGYFDNTACHRLTTAGIYVLQCGDPTGTGGGGPGFKTKDENLTALGTGSSVIYPRGIVAMANAVSGLVRQIFKSNGQPLAAPQQVAQPSRATPALPAPTRPEFDMTPNLKQKEKVPVQRKGDDEEPGDPRKTIQLLVDVGALSRGVLTDKSGMITKEKAQELLNKYYDGNQDIAEGICSLAEAHAIFDDFEQAMAARGLNEDAFDTITDEQIIRETAAWRRSAGKSKKGGLNAKGVASYRREHPGSHLQMAVTTKPSKLKPGSKAAKRRKSFCARMSGVDGPMKKPNGKPTRKALALRKWNC